MKNFFLIFFLISSAAFSQKKTSLKQALSQLSKTHHIEFSYSEDIIQKFKTITIDSKLNLEQVLLSMSLQTDLVYEKIDAKNYIIRNKTKKTHQVCGVVFSQKNKQTLPFVNINCNNKVVVTNKQGRFNFSGILRDDIITINLIGYKQINIPVKNFDKNCKNIFLEEKVNQLNEIVITNYLTTGFTKTKDGSIVLNSKKAGVLPGVIEPDVLQSLQLIPGVQSPNETASGIHIRGSTPDQNLVIFDGMKMYHFSHYFGLLSAFNPYITNNVKLYRSGTHAKYGNNVGGVLDIGTDNDIPESLSVGIGSTLTHSDVFIKTPLLNKKLGFVFSARRSITDYINSYTNQQYANVVFQNSKIGEGLDDQNLRITNANNNFFYKDYHAKVIVAPNNNSKISFSYLYNLNDLFFTGENERSREHFEDDISIENQGFHFDWELGNIKKGLHKIELSQTNFYKNYDGNRSIENRTQDGINYNKSNTINENNLEYSFIKNIKKNYKWEFGYQFNFNDVRYNFNRTVSEQNGLVNDQIIGKAWNSALFSEHQLKLKEKWLLNLGLRWQYFGGIDKNYLEPRFNLTYKVNHHLNFKFSTELKHQSIAQVLDFREDGLGGLFDQFWALANKNVFPVLKSVQSSAGIGYQTNSWIVDFEVYNKSIDGILFLFDENEKGQKYFNGTNNIKGIDLLIKKDWNQYNTWISYSLSKSIYQFDDLNSSENFNGSFDIPHSLIWSHNYKIKKLEFSLGWRFRSGIPYTVKTAEIKNPNGLKIEFDELNSERLPNYQRLDFTTRYKFNFDKAKKVNGQFGLTIQNIFNKKNVLNRDYEIQTIIESQGPDRIIEKDVLVEVDRTSLGFVPNLIFRVDF